MFDPPVFTSVEAAMRSILDDVSRGYTYCVTGTVESLKALPLAVRFHERYELGMDRRRRYRCRASGNAVFSMHIFPVPSESAFKFWLLRTEGKHPLLSMEKWYDVRDHSIRWLWWYELIRLPVDVQHQRKMRSPEGREKIKPVTWTWRICRDDFEDMKGYVRHVVQHRDQRLDGAIESLRRAIGFRGVRIDVRALYRYIETQCTYRKVECPSIPRTVRWVGRRRASQALPLSSLARRAGRTAVWLEQSEGAVPTVHTHQ